MKEEVLSQLLFQIHTLFSVSAEDDEARRCVREALDRVHGLEEACCDSGGAFSIQDCALFLLRKELCDIPAASQSPSLLPCFGHIERTGFFGKVPVEVATWTRRFLQMVRTHRIDPEDRQNRLDRYRQLRASVQGRLAPAIRKFDDLLIWLEFRLVEAPSLQTQDAGSLSRELANELEGLLTPQVLDGEPLQPALFVLLACHRYCAEEAGAPSERERHRRLLSTRRLDSLLDLMRVVVQLGMKEVRPPDASTVLDRLQVDGFNIQHRGFKDPYEAYLAPLIDTERLEGASLALFHPLDRLSGDYERDAEADRATLSEWHLSIGREVLADCEAYIQAVRQPLPRSHLVQRIIRFSVSWTLAGIPWSSPMQPGNELAEKALGLLPEHALRLLARPRKGYEIKSKSELSGLVRREAGRQGEAIERIAAERRIQGRHDYIQFCRYLVFRHLQERFGHDPGPVLSEAGAAVRSFLASERPAQVARKWGVEAHQADPDGLDSVRRYLTGAIRAERIEAELKKGFETSSAELQKALETALDRMAPIYYRLVVAYGRHRAKMPRIEAPLSAIPELVTFLAPPLALMQSIASDRIRENFTRYGQAFYRRHIRPYILDGGEWKAYLAWHVTRCIEERFRGMGRDLTRFLEARDLDDLLNEAQKAATRADLAPNALEFETVQSTLLGLLDPPNQRTVVPEEHIGELLAELPGLDCGACGESSCRALARALLSGSGEAARCTRLPARQLPRIAEILKQYKAPTGALQPGLLDILRDRSLWKKSSETEAFRNVLSAPVQKARSLFRERLRSIWESLSPKPRIFICPGPEALYRELCRYMGREAAERIREEERLFLAEHGDERMRHEWRLARERQDWLVAANRDRRSGPLQKGRDAAWSAQSAYDGVFFLHQLSERDRELVLRHRLERHQDGFSHWWNEDLLDMNLPGYSIRDWEDFSKIIKNAYWHQEQTLAAGDAAAVIASDPAFLMESQRIFAALLDNLIDAERGKLERDRQLLAELRRGEDRAVIEGLPDLRRAAGALFEELQLDDSRVRADLSGAHGLSSEDLAAIELEGLWKRLQAEGFTFSPSFSCRWQELLPLEAEILRRSTHAGDMGTTAEGPSGAAFFLAGWDGPLKKRAALIRAVLAALIRERHRRRTECEWLKSARGDMSTSPGSIRPLVAQQLKEGKTRAEIKKWMDDLIEHHADLRNSLLREALCSAVLGLQEVQLDRSTKGLHRTGAPASRQWSFLDGFPEIRSLAGGMLDGHRTMDRERLLKYLFLLARMEGNLDTITALLREIRETSDIIEAAWLRFTQDRLMEGPGTKGMPGTMAGIPLLVSRMSDKGPVNRCLRDGVSRREKRNVASAVAELLTFVRYHILLRLSRHPDSIGDQEVLSDILTAGYDLTGVDEESLSAAVRKEFDRRERLEGQKIWIYTTAVVRLLAAQSLELQEAERLFHKVRTDIFKEDGQSAAGCHEIAVRRGIALGQIKEKLYHQLSDLLEPERIATFQGRVRQIVDQLDEKRHEIHQGWLRGEINRRTMFYILRQFQKADREPSLEDFERFIKDHWLIPLSDLRRSIRPDREERIRALDERFQALLGASLLGLEEEASEAAQQDLKDWMCDQLESSMPAGAC